MNQTHHINPGAILALLGSLTRWTRTKERASATIIPCGVLEARRRAKFSKEKQ